MSPRPLSCPVMLSIALAIAFVAGCDSSAPGGHSGPQRVKPAVVISQVRADRNAFHPAKAETATIRFHLDKAADVTLSIYDGRDRLVWDRSAKGLAAGDHALTWDGHDGSGKPVPAEAYTYTLKASNAKGRSVHDLTDLTGGQPIAAKDVRWDAASGRIHYYLDTPARVNLRLGLESGPYLRTVVDWVPRAAGAHAEAWDGKDASGVLNLSDHPMLQPAVTAYTLPDNTLFVGAPPDRIAFVAQAAATPQRPRSDAAPKQIANYAQQPLETRGDLEAKLAPVGEFKRDADGRWVVTGVVSLRADVAAKDRQRAIARRFEAMFYVDGLFTYENELGYLPMTWQWDTRGLNPGEHVVTLNIRGYEGNFGTATVKVWVEPAASATATQAGPGPVERK
jgi:FlgD Ig-like domain